MKTLTPELKAYYMADFEQNVLTCKDETWKLDEGLSTLLTKINQSPNVQTLYSRKRNDANDKNRVSFLWILISKDVTNAKLNNFIQESKKKLADFECAPFENIGAPKFLTHANMNCITDENYFKNGAIVIRIDTPVQHNHNVFWKLIEKHLTKF